MAKTDITKLGQDVAWQDVTRGNTIVGAGTTREFITCLLYTSNLLMFQDITLVV